MIPVYLNVLLIIIVTYATADEVTNECPVGFIKVDEKPYCYKLKPPERFEDAYKDCVGNLHTLEMVEKMKLPKNITLWTQYKSFYSGGPYDHTGEVKDKRLISNDVEYEGTPSLKEEYCIVINKRYSKPKAVSCKEGNYHRYCLVPIFSNFTKHLRDSRSQCVDSSYKRFFSPRATCLRLINGISSNWSYAQSTLCESVQGSVLHRGWRLANALSTSRSSWTYPLGMFMTSANTLLWSVEENGNTTVPESEYSFDDKRVHSEDQKYVAINNNSWKFVNSTDLFTTVVCEQTVQLGTPKLNLSIINNEIILKVTSEIIVKKEDISCYTDSMSWKIVPRTITSKSTNVYKVKIYVNGYYWCEVSNPMFFHRVESEKVLYIDDPESLKMTYAVMVKRKNKYKFDDNEDDIINDFIDNVKDHLSEESEASVTMSNVIRLYVDRKTVLLRLEMDKTVTLEGSRKLDNVEIIYIKPIYFCNSVEANGVLGESVIAKGKNYTCVGNFYDGVNWVVNAIDGETTTTTGDFDSTIMETTTNKEKKAANSEENSYSKEQGDLIQTETPIPTDPTVPIDLTDEPDDTTLDPTGPSENSVQPPPPPTTTVRPTTNMSTTEFTTEATTEYTNTPTTTRTPEEHIQNIIDEINNMLNTTDPIHVANVQDVFTEADQFFDGETDVEIPNRLLKLIDTLTDRVDLQGNRTVTAIMNNIAMVVSENRPDFHVRGLRVVASDQGFVDDAFQVLSTEQQYNIVANETEAVVYLPNSVAGDSGRISFVVYRNGRSFRENSTEESFVNSKVFSIKVENVTQFQANEYVEISFRPREEPGRNRSRRCMFWQFSGNSTGSWSETGCRLIEAESEGGLDICRCDHLTHFAEILVNRVVFSQADEDALEVISLVGCCLSIIGLAMVAITAMLFRSWRRDFTNKIWLQLCISIFILCVCFLIVVFYRFNNYNVGCMLTGVALHYSVLASFCWMMIAAVLSYRRLVLVFTRDLSHKLLKAAAFCWGAPCVVIGILLAVSPLSYEINIDEKRTTTSFCYPSGAAIWITVYAPIALMLLVNWTLFVLIVRSVFFSKDNTLSSNRDHRDAFRCASVSCLLVLLFGLTWLFGLFSNIIAFAYLFNITSTFQGFFLFMFFIVGNKKTRDLWLNKLKIKQTRAIPVTSTTMTNKSTGQGWRSATTSGESNVPKPKSLSSPDNTRFS